MKKHNHVGLLGIGALVLLALSSAACSGLIPDTTLDTNPVAVSHNIKVYASPT